MIANTRLTDLDDIRYFRLQLIRYAVADFQNSALAAIYFEKFGLRELEFSRRVTFKSAEKPEISIEIPERLWIGRLSPELGGGVVRVWMTEEAPEPWSLPTPTVRTAKQSPPQSTDPIGLAAGDSRD